MVDDYLMQRLLRFGHLDVLKDDVHSTAWRVESDRLAVNNVCNSAVVDILRVNREDAQ